MFCLVFFGICFFLKLKIHYSLHEILARRKKTCKVQTVNWFLFRYHMGQGHTLWILRKPQEIYSWNKDGVCRHQESPRERTSHRLPGKLDKITMAFNRTLNYWFFLNKHLRFVKISIYIHSSQHDSCKKKLWFIHKSEKRYFKHYAVDLPPFEIWYQFFHWILLDNFSVKLGYLRMIMQSRWSFIMYVKTAYPRMGGLPLHCWTSYILLKLFFNMYV